MRFGNLHIDNVRTGTIAIDLWLKLHQYVILKGIDHNDAKELFKLRQRF